MLKKINQYNLIGLLKEVLSTEGIDMWRHVNVEIVQLPEHAKSTIRITGNFLSVDDFVDSAWEKNEL